MGGAAQPAAAVGGSDIERELKKTAHLVRSLLLPCSFPAPSLLYPAPFGLLSSAICVRRRCWWLVEGGWKQVMVRDDDVAADGRRELWGGAWESGLREISNNDLKLPEQIIFHFNQFKYYVYVNHKIYY